MPTRQPRDRPVILVVDSNEDVREMYCTYFNYIGYDCVGSATGDDALRILYERLPDLVLLEESTPGIDGWQLLKLIKSDPALRSAVKVVLLTTDVFEAPRQRAEHMGADGFAAKPVLNDDLARLVRRVLKT